MKTNKTISEFKEFIAKGNVMDFLIVAACIFAMLKYLAHFKKTTNDQLDQKEPKKDGTVVLLEEIRDLLKKIDKVK